MPRHAERPASTDSANKDASRRKGTYWATGALGAVVLTGTLLLNHFDVQGEHLPSVKRESQAPFSLFSEFDILNRDRVLQSPDAMRRLGICAQELQAELTFEESQRSSFGQRATHVIEGTKKGLAVAEQSGLTRCTPNPNPERAITLSDQTVIYRYQVTEFRSLQWCSDRQILTQNNENGIVSGSDQLTAWVAAGDRTFQPCNETV